MAVLGRTNVLDSAEHRQGPASSLLMVTHVPLRTGPGGLQIDDQTAAEISQWLRYFDRITYMGVAEEHAGQSSSTRWVDIAGDSAFGRCRLVALPNAYRPLQMLRALPFTRRRLREAIADHQHLCFTVGGLFGDWAAVASLEAARQGRGYANRVDRVEGQVFREKARHGGQLRRMATAVYAPLVERYTQYVLQQGRVALLQGLDVFNHYRAYCADPHCTYDTHTHASDFIGEADLARKRAGIVSGRPLKILYVGRAAPMKGPGDWLDVLEGLTRQGVEFTATWIGDGPDLALMKDRVQASALSGSVLLPGFMDDRETLLRSMRESDLLLYCHKTLESPRCLIEALVSGCPLVGYGTDYSRGLVAAHGGGEFAEMNDVVGLTNTVLALDRDRDRLSHLVSDAATSGRQYSEDVLFEHRARLMQTDVRPLR